MKQYRLCFETDSLNSQCFQKDLAPAGMRDLHSVYKASLVHNMALLISHMTSIVRACVLWHHSMQCAVWCEHNLTVISRLGCMSADRVYQCCWFWGFEGPLVSVGAGWTGYEESWTRTPLVRKKVGVAGNWKPEWQEMIIHHMVLLVWLKVLILWWSAGLLRIWSRLKGCETSWMPISLITRLWTSWLRTLRRTLVGW